LLGGGEVSLQLLQFRRQFFQELLDVFLEQLLRGGDVAASRSASLIQLPGVGVTLLIPGASRGGCRCFRRAGSLALVCLRRLLGCAGLLFRRGRTLRLLRLLVSLLRSRLVALSR
jgi:hypothetical protein